MPPAVAYAVLAILLWGIASLLWNIVQHPGDDYADD